MKRQMCVSQPTTNCLTLQWQQYFCDLFIFFLLVHLCRLTWVLNQSLRLGLGLETQSLGLGLGLVDPSLDYITGYFPQTLRRIVYALQNLDRNYPNLVAPPTDGSAKCLVRCKAHFGPVTDFGNSVQIDASARTDRFWECHNIAVTFDHVVFVTQRPLLISSDLAECLRQLTLLCLLLLHNNQQTSSWYGVLR